MHLTSVLSISPMSISRLLMRLLGDIFVTLAASPSFKSQSLIILFVFINYPKIETWKYPIIIILPQVHGGYEICRFSI
jgi:hypothetical protein